MRVYVNARFLTQPLSGVQRYARELVAALAARGAFRIIALVPASVTRPAGWDGVEIRLVPGGRGHLWEQRILARAAMDGPLLSLTGSGPLSHPCHVLAIHDANIWDVPQAFSWRYRSWHRHMRPALARRAAGLITVSQYSAQRLASCLGVAASRFTVIGNSAEHIRQVAPDPGILGRHGLSAQPYLLALGSAGPNKNIEALLQAHARLADAPQIVLAGGNLPGLAQGQPDCLCVGRVSDAALRALYEGAQGFVFPSLSEGFGIPPLEAMQLGVPVLAARSGALPEILGDAALWCDPLSEVSMVEGLQKLSALSGPARRWQIAAGQSRAAQFSWAHSAAMLKELLSEHVTRRWAA